MFVQQFMQLVSGIYLHLQNVFSIQIQQMYLVPNSACMCIMYVYHVYIGNVGIHTHTEGHVP